jgi:4-diphosphocytidyl-2-C-methyl-D-erythritol kinase
LELLAPAKVNLGLSVRGRRDDGYHELHTIFAALELGDEVILEPRPKGIELASPWGSQDLAYRAAASYLAATGWPGGVRLQLHKRIPPGAGLGGGSSDAAAVLKGLAQLYPADLDLVPLAQALGADVPFFLQLGVREARGIGERLVSLALPRLPLLVVYPGIPLATREVFADLSPWEWGPELPVEEVLAALREGVEPPYWNSLEAPAFRKLPLLRELKELLKSLGLYGVLMSGSGSAIFGFPPTPEDGKRILRSLQGRFPWVQLTFLGGL